RRVATIRLRSTLISNHFSPVNHLSPINWACRTIHGQRRRVQLRAPGVGQVSPSRAAALSRGFGPGHPVVVRAKDLEVFGVREMVRVATRVATTSLTPMTIGNHFSHAKFGSATV
ncbi:hypothetical protein, partial [Nocardia altamirensis]|uniref:hypothetical protein n=1 Tax=Nocardia altamirensis TaxID=472158 RepID=UPI001C3F71CD